MIHTHSSYTLTEKEILIQPILKGIAENNREYIKEFFDIFSDDIYNFPIRYYNFNEDDAGEFYLYAFEHLKSGKKIRSYQYKSKFTTWFFSVLRNLVIDFLRKNKNKIKTVSYYKSDQDGKDMNLIDNIPESEIHISVLDEDDQMKKFIAKLNSLKMYNRVLFKLAFIHYIDLNHEEITWLCDINHVSEPEMLSVLSDLKDIGLSKSQDVRDIEDKLTANFLSIGMLDNKINNFFKENPTFLRQEKLWEENYVNPDLPEQVNDMIQSLMKKKKKHIALIDSQKKSLMSTRLPYKHFAYLLDTSEGVISVQLLRIIEKLNSGFY